MAGQVEADVCVVGAGFAGLTAARRLTQAGRSVVVMEARPRVGGRTWTDRRNGFDVDRGGAWLAPQHEPAFSLAAEVGVATYKTHVAGHHLLVGDDRVRKYTGLIPRISPMALLQIAALQTRIDRMARRVPVEAPWAAPAAARWDAVSLGSWLARHRVRSSLGHALFDMAVRGLFAAEDLSDVSMLDLLFLVHAHRSIESLFSIENGAQENLVEGGMGAFAERLATELGGAVHLATPVRSITQDDHRVVVASERLSVTSSVAVVTAPPALVLDISFEPALPEDRLTLYRRAVGGVETKSLLVFDEPFWRHDGLSGQSAEPLSAAEVTIDASPKDGAYGVLACFTFGHVAKRLDSMPEAERRAALLDTLRRRFGPKAASPAEVVHTSWFTEPWSRGCSVAHFPPGLLTAHGHLLRAPMGRVHWAGTETATVSHGAIDGAIRSGERVAAEVLERWNVF